ncbi:competence protein ComFA [Enterococcus sp. DIV0840]|uniref:DEAD/DEAH box helicase n=1 Tax=Enterococcus TaxID=1350 RepID=UPI001A8F58E6|nr:MULTISPECIES: DEAD/DEAH box helicase family protein [Enterococcus]MBO0433231.1 DEAD/DEAH box helicase family protein [Enterococcus sp. DIV0849a]MBO0473390.1 DEAD/DEAH box helicase family protein [Enterococcus ureasiticus]
MQELWGRKVLKKEIENIEAAEEQSQKLLTMQEVNEKTIQCLRCGQVQNKSIVQLVNGHYFCPECIQLGRVDTSQDFYHLPEPNPVKRTVDFAWKGQLTDGQQAVSNDLVASVKKGESRMIWAVTGAGKTEMLFKAIHHSLESGYRVAIASPRVDVCLELYPRIQAVFPDEPAILLHGKMEERYRYTKLLVCTTHQLLRFFQAFDVLIIDEVDAFPFVDNPLLQYGVNQAIKKNSSLVYLTATPTKELTKKTAQNQLKTSILPARYHRRILPVPKMKWCSRWHEKIKKGNSPKTLVTKIRTLVTKNDVLIFCPSISLMEKLKEAVEKKFPKVPLACVHSQDPERLEKVLKMRNKEYRILMTSTILERGVTFDGVSVIVLGANHAVFATSALVQIAGRVDRRKEYTAGEVWFLHDGCTKSMKEAIKQIKKMNTLGIERGLIDEM